MRNEKHNWLIYIHIVLILWTILYLYCLFFNKAQMLSFLAKGIAAALFINIPIGIRSFVYLNKRQVSKRLFVMMSILAITNIVIGAVAWFFLILLLRKP